MDGYSAWNGSIEIGKRVDICGVTFAVGTRVSTPQASEETNDGTTCRSQRTVRKDRRDGKVIPHGKQNMTIKFDDYLPKWNYTAIPEGS